MMSRRAQIRIDGLDIKDMDMADLRRRYGVVLQDPFLFTGTVEGNIRLGTSASRMTTLKRLPKM